MPLRRQDKSGSIEVAWEVLRRSPVVHLATTAPDGAPVLRPLHAVVHAGAVWFHGAPKGEKTASIGRSAVVMAHEVVAEIPSWFADPERACPATTFYRSASVHGVIEEVDDPMTKAAVLQALMARYQPGGGHRPITALDPLYAAAVRGIGVLRVAPSKVVAKVALGQMKSALDRRRIIDGLWVRGDAGDAAAIEAMLDVAPLDPLPEFLQGPGGLRLVVAPGERHVDGAVELLAGEYWNHDVPTDTLRAAQLGSDAWVVALDGDRVVATARALSDGVKTAYVADVAVQSSYRGRGVGAAVARTLVAHPRLRRVQRIDLLTRDAGGFWERQGFAALPREVRRRRNTDATAL